MKPRSEVARAALSRQRQFADNRLERARLVAAVFETAPGQELLSRWIGAFMFAPNDATTGEQALKREGQREFLRMIQQDMELAHNETQARSRS